MRYAILGLAVIATLGLGQGVGAAQQMQPHDEMMMHTTALQGVVTSVRHVSCSGTAPQTCQGIFEVTPAAPGEMMMHEPAKSSEHMMMAHPVTVIVVPGTALNWQNSQLPLTKLKVGDQVKLEYFTVNNMNICASLTMTGMGHM